jgi:hypothetical protein
VEPDAEDQLVGSVALESSLGRGPARPPVISIDINGPGGSLAGCDGCAVVCARRDGPQAAPGALVARYGAAVWLQVDGGVS